MLVKKNQGKKNLKLTSTAQRHLDNVFTDVKCFKKLDAFVATFHAETK